MTSSHRWSLAAAYRLTSSVAQRDDAGAPQQYTPSRRFVAVVTAVLYVMNPAVEIRTRAEGASARITNVATSRNTLNITVVLLVAAIAALAISDRVVIYLPSALATPVLLGLILPSTSIIRRLPPERNEIATHLLTDVTRHPNGQPGSGRALVASLADPDRCIDGTAANAEMFQKVYAGIVTVTGHSSNGEIHFTLGPKEI